MAEPLKKLFSLLQKLSDTFIECFSDNQMQVNANKCYWIKVICKYRNTKN